MRQRPSSSRRQTMRKRHRTRGASEPFGPLTQVARPSVPAKSPVPSVDVAAISIEEMLMCGGSVEQGASSFDRRHPGAHEDRIVRVEVHPRREIGRLERFGESLLSCADGGDVGSRKVQRAESLLRRDAHPPFATDAHVPGLAGFGSRDRLRVAVARIRRIASTCTEAGLSAFARTKREWRIDGLQEPAGSFGGYPGADGDHGRRRSLQLQRSYLDDSQIVSSRAIMGSTAS